MELPTTYNYPHYPRLSFKKNNYHISEDNFFWVECALGKNLINTIALENKGMVDDTFFTIMLEKLDNSHIEFHYIKQDDYLYSVKKDTKPREELEVLSHRDLFKRYGAKAFIIIDEDYERTMSTPGRYKDEHIYMNHYEVKFNAITEETTERIERIKAFHTT